MPDTTGDMATYGTSDICVKKKKKKKKKNLIDLIRNLRK